MMRATSSHRSSGIEMSGRQYGTVTSHPSLVVSTPKPSEARVVSTTFVPGIAAEDTEQFVGGQTDPVSFRAPSRPFVDDSVRRLTAGHLED